MKLHMPLTSNPFNDVRDFAVALVFFAFDNAVACTLSSNSIILRFLAAITDMLLACDSIVRLFEIEKKEKKKHRKSD